MKNKIQTVIGIIKVAQDHVVEIKTHGSCDSPANQVLDELAAKLSSLLVSLDKLNRLMHPQQTNP